MLISASVPRLISWPAIPAICDGAPEALDRVGDVGEVARRVQVAEADDVTRQRLGDDGRDDGAGGLPRAIGVEGPHGDDGSPNERWKLSTSLSAPILLAE